MTCFHPLSAWISKDVNPVSGKHYLVFGTPTLKSKFEHIDLPCGKCIGCRLNYSRQWAMRCMHESRLHKENCFVTFTYNDEHVRWSSVTGEQTLFKKDLQLFWKRLRKALDPIKFRYFACGEYGDTTNRPHYHAIIFGYDFKDKELYSVSPAGFPLYTSKFLDDVWSLGQCKIADVSFDSCAYVARYVMKKLSGAEADIKYEGIQKEFTVMSRKPGIGRDFYEKFKSDFYPYDRAILIDDRGSRQLKPPRYYDNLYDLENPDEFKKIKDKRIAQAKLHEAEYSQPGRLEAMEKFKLSQTKGLKRRYGKYENI